MQWPRRSVRPLAACAIALASLVSLGSLASLVSLVSAAQAQQVAWPAKPVRLVITFPPGGSVDVVPRLVVAKLGERWGQPWVVDNRPGAGGQIAVDIVVKAPADGYTLLVGPTGAIAINPSLYKKLAYDPLKDLVPIVSFARAPMVLVVPVDGPPTMNELIAQSKAKPGQLNYGHGGNGTGMHLTGEMFKMVTGADLTPVPFKTSGAVIATMAGGQLSAGWVDTNFALTGIRGGRVKALIVASRERSAVLPDIPSIAEAGYANFDALGWFGLFAPTGTPPEVIAKINAEVQKVLQLPDVRERILATGNDPWWSTPDDFGAFVRTEIIKWARVVRQSGATAD
ncbi:MAG: tripartite tricarboxylate transporter substrate binding protein [Pseudolabrys sp.]|nr:tripartite tricarboxylate transporter substrate binding protein [Pseudolabrys sp.]